MPATAVILTERRQQDVSEIEKLPRRLKLANRVIIALQRRALAIGTMRVLSVAGARVVSCVPRLSHRSS